MVKKVQQKTFVDDDAVTLSLEQATNSALNEEKKNSESKTIRKQKKGKQPKETMSSLTSAWVEDETPGRLAIAQRTSLFSP